MSSILDRPHEELAALDSIRRDTGAILDELRQGRDLGGIDVFVPLSWEAGKLTDYDHKSTPYAGVLVINLSEADCYIGFGAGQGRELAADLELGPRCWIALPWRGGQISVGGETAGRVLVAPLHIAPTPAMGELAQPEPRFAPIAANALGDSTVVAAVATKRIRVQDYTLVVAAAVAVKFKSGAATDLTGAMPFGANGGSSPSTRRGSFQTARGEDLVINLGGAVSVGGHLSYTLEG